MTSVLRPLPGAGLRRYLVVDMKKKLEIDVGPSWHF